MTELEKSMVELIHKTRNEAIEACAKIVGPKGPRPCDCERCNCHNQGDAEAVAAWDEAAANAKAIRSLMLLAHFPYTGARMTDLFTKDGPVEGDTIVVWFSNGAASAVALQETLRRYGNMCKVVAVNNPVAEEDPDNIRFAQDVMVWLGCPIVYWRSRRFPSGSAVEVWETERAMSFPHGAPCTKHLKRIARQEYESCHRVDWHVFGFASEEKDRHDDFVLSERSNVLPVLIEAGLTRQDCYDRLVDEGVEPPRVYAEGFPNANCMGCVKATSPTYWNLLRVARPAVFQQRAEQSRRLGVRLVRYKGKRIFLDELPPDAVGRPLKSMKIECGIVCEERPSKRKPRQLEAAE